MSRFVLDCSVSAAWFLSDESSEAAEKILHRLADEEAVVPPLWIAEMANVLVMAERRGRIAPADASRAVELVMSLPIQVEFADLRTLNASRLLAREYDLSAYDASYLELAQRAGLPLATMDRILSTAARRCGVPVLPERPE
ncbi:MAG: type II toxin-antitoxin system VapC family toxin [Syntrophobacteraceae bacterium]